MTDTPSDAAIVKALRRSGEPGFWTVEEIRRRADECYPAATLAHAKTLQEVSDALAGYWGGAAKTPDRFSPFIIPQPDPDEELAREMAEQFATIYPHAAEEVALATIKRLRADGRLTDAK